MTKGRFVDPAGDRWYWDLPRNFIQVGPEFMAGWQDGMLVLSFSRQHISEDARPGDRDVVVEVMFSKDDFGVFLDNLLTAFPADGEWLMTAPDPG